MPLQVPPASNLPQWIGDRAGRHADRIALTFVRDDRSEQSWTYAELWSRACSVANRLPEVTEAHPRGLLLYAPGIEFVAGFLGCQIAGWVPVPTCYPRGGRELVRLDSVATDCAPSALLGDAESLSALDPDLICKSARNVPRLATDSIQTSPTDWLDPSSLAITPQGLALLQYTSGSTSEPKGVQVRHRNMMANLEAIRRGFHIDWQADEEVNSQVSVFWLPFFHDMGLIGGVLEPLYVGGRTVLMSPRSFLQRPIRWLQAISDYRAVISGAPNFAYQLCVDRISPDQADSLDLSSWRVAFSGAEPVLPRTVLDFSNRFGPCGFSSKSFLPCYGLAEATLMAACGDGPGEPRLLRVDRDSLSDGHPRLVNKDSNARSSLTIVNCGGPANETELLIVDPVTQQETGSQRVGEIWLRGPGVTDGYWNRSEENEQRFQARLADGRHGFCRTGDLGFVHDGDLYITGRLKDLIIIGGRNLFPQDIEETVRSVLGSNAGKSAAFAVDGGRGESLAIVAELPRQFDEARLPELVRDVRREVIEVHEVDPRHVLLVRQATIPLTSSGKIQRNRCREQMEADEIKCRHRYDRNSASSQAPILIPNLPSEMRPEERPRTQSSIESWIVEWLIARGGVAPGDVDLERPFAEYGLDSMTAVEMSGEIEDWSGVALNPVVAWNYPTVSRLSGYITDQLFGENGHDGSSAREQSIESLLGEIEQMSDAETSHALASKRPK